MIPLLENATLIGDLSLDGGLSSQDTWECLRRGERVTRVVFGNRPHTTASGHHLFRVPSPFTDPMVVRPDPFDLKILSISSGTVPRLESLEAYHLSSLTDEDLPDVITSRINASQRGETAALKSVKIYFQRPRQKDITEDVTRLAKESGSEVKLDLIYPPEGNGFFDRLSPSNDDMWSSDMI